MQLHVALICVLSTARALLAPRPSVRLRRRGARAAIPEALDAFTPEALDALRAFGGRVADAMAGVVPGIAALQASASLFASVFGFGNDEIEL